MSFTVHPHENCSGDCLPVSTNCRQRKRRLFTGGTFKYWVPLTCLALFLCFGIESVFPQSTSKPLQVLFIGNSLTYVNNLPEMLEQLSASAKDDPRIVARMVVAGGATLELHWQIKQAQQAIQIGRWDFVVLQEQSTLGPSPLLDGLPTIRSPDNFFKFARMFDEVIRQAGARTVFFSTWARRGGPPQNQQALDYAYMHIASELKARVVPVGQAWQEIEKADPSLHLYAPDGSHPSPAGTYLSACLFYAALTGRSPEGLTSHILGPSVDDAGRIDEDHKILLVDLSPLSARRLQLAAWKVYRDLDTAGGYFPVSAPPERTAPPLPAGRRPTPKDLEGNWVGETRVFPSGASGPIKLELRLSREDEGWEGDVRVSLRDQARNMTSPINDFQITDTGISFIQPQVVGNSIVKYKGVFTGKELVGDAQVITKDGTVVAIGRWSLKHRR